MRGRGLTSQNLLFLDLPFKEKWLSWAVFFFSRPTFILTSRFSGLMSRWMTFLEWQYCKASANWAMYCKRMRLTLLWIHYMYCTVQQSNEFCFLYLYIVIFTQENKLWQCINKRAIVGVTVLTCATFTEIKRTINIFKEHSAMDKLRWYMVSNIRCVVWHTRALIIYSQWLSACLQIVSLSAGVCTVLL